MDIQTTLSQSELETLAVSAAKNQQWDEAIGYNQQILADSPDDIGAHNRLGVSYAQIKKLSEAKSEFEKVLELDKSNQIAKKHLQKLKSKQSINICSLTTPTQFIEEPGKTKVVELHRLAGRDVLEHLMVGEECQLKPKGRYVSVETLKGCYIGSLPEDVSFTLTKLMRTNNTYACYVRSVSSTACSVFLSETHRSKENEFVHSFPTSRSSAAVEDFYLDGEDTTLLEEIAAPDIVGTDDFEHTLENRRHFGEEPAEEEQPDPEEMREEKEREEMS